MVKTLYTLEMPCNGLNVATSPLPSKQPRIHERLTPRRRGHHTPTSPDIKSKLS